MKKSAIEIRDLREKNCSLCSVYEDDKVKRNGADRSGR
jgi:hypothetical protein